MRIDRLDVYYVEMRMARPWKTAYGEDTTSDVVLVKATSGEHAGWSEAAPFHSPTYLDESAGSVFYNVTKIFGPHVVGGEYETAKELNDRLTIYKVMYRLTQVPENYSPSKFIWIVSAVIFAWASLSTSRLRGISSLLSFSRMS